ncbi:uncharacterized protein LAJ45_10129 [Morchella importuna]|uniref:uncharacterized protein n=1 Tax=Morchella importuna TaxID=1174673 RepID=UPI001E8E0D10|nr:uncharacterized protein LAJ45_10129 [Morchella importuna]KAH8145806.1 hypothetical protein LAJ45_10129 [Morchella importuna]
MARSLWTHNTPPPPLGGNLSPQNKQDTKKPKTQINNEQATRLRTIHLSTLHTPAPPPLPSHDPTLPPRHYTAQIHAPYHAAENAADSSATIGGAGCRVGERVRQLKVPPVRMMGLVGMSGLGCGVTVRRGRGKGSPRWVERGEGRGGLVAGAVAGARAGVESGVDLDDRGRVEVASEER